MKATPTFQFPDDLYYDRDDHLWVRKEGDRIWVGMDQLAQTALGPVVHVALPKVGKVMDRGDAVGSLEAEKMVTTLLTPIGGTILERNQALLERPRLLQEDPYGKGWLFAATAPDFDRDLSQLVHGAIDLAEWVASETKRYVENRWIDPA